MHGRNDSLAAKVHDEFTREVRHRGQDYFDRGQVRIVSVVGGTHFKLQAFGSETYDIDVRVEKFKSSWELLVECTCPYMQDTDYCKHIWAAILEVDRAGKLGPAPSRIGLGIHETAGWDPFEKSKFAPPIEVLEKLMRLTFSGNEDAVTSKVLQLPKKLKDLAKGAVLPKPTKPKPPPEPPWTGFLRQLADRSFAYAPYEVSAPAAAEPLYLIEQNEGLQDRPFVIVLAQKKKNSTSSPPDHKELKIGSHEISSLSSALDRNICLMIMGGGRDEWGYQYGSPRLSRFQIPPVLREPILPRLFETGRVYFKRSRYEDGIAPLSFDGGDPWDFRIQLAADAKGDRYRFQGCFQRGEQRVELPNVDYLVYDDPGMFIHNGVLSRANTDGCAPWIQQLIKGSNFSVPRQSKAQFIHDLAQCKSVPLIDWPAEWNVRVVENEAPQPELHLEFGAGDGKPATKIQGDVKFKYADNVVNATERRSTILDANTMVQLRRDASGELKNIGRLRELGFGLSSTGRMQIGQRALPGVVASLMNEGWTVMGDRAMFRRPGEYQAELTSGIDWFDLQGGMDFEGQHVPVPRLLDAARKGERFVRLDDGTLGVLPDEWLAKHRALLDLGHVEGDVVRFKKTQLGLIDVLLSQMPEARFDQTIAKSRQRLKQFDGIKPRDPSEEFVGDLRPYQKQGLGWLHFLKDFGWGGCLADDMGLGKTVQVLAFLADAKLAGATKPSLVVMPKSLIFNWMREAQKFASKLRVLNYTGIERAALTERIPQSDLVLTTYGTLRLDIDKLREQPFHYAILDEAQAAKNPESLNAKAARLLQADHRLVLTGTPVENHVGDLWSLFEFLNPGMLGAKSAFNSSFRGSSTQTERGAAAGSLHSMLRPFILRRTKEQVAPELPQRTEKTIECEMPPKQAAYYTELRDFYRAKLLGQVDKSGLAKSKMHVLEALLRLRQVACHPALVDKAKSKLETAKMEAFWPMIDELIDGGHKALVFSQFTEYLALVRKELDNKGIVYEYLDGQTHKRDEHVDRFQNDEKCPLFLISLKAGGVGLNLTAADYVFLLDPWWNPAVEAQAIDRTHRIGQTRSVIAYRLIARGTVEAKIMELQKTKRELVGAIINQNNSLLQDLTRDDLAELLS